MKGQTLMLITDISGYTRFFTRVGHEEGIRRAQDLLQIIINENTLGLKLCEVEGDAVFFYSMHKLPSQKAIMRQIRRTYNAFNHYLQMHHLDAELGIKFFMHTGICEEVRIGGRTKLYGMEVIKIHRLLKSIVNSNDYILVTKSASETLGFDAEAGMAAWNTFPHIGEVNYVVYNETFLSSVDQTGSRYRTMVSTIGSGCTMLADELGKVYRTYGAFVNPLQLTSERP